MPSTKPVTQCRHFNGYKPCAKNASCSSFCPSVDVVEESVLIVHLGALGAVVRSTSLLSAIHQKHPRAKIIWLTEKSAAALLQNNPAVDQVVIADMEGMLSLKSYEFSFGYVIDKSLKASGLASSLKVQNLRGFTALNGAILPATPAAEELWKLGLDDFEKFFVNLKPETQLITEALELTYRQDEYYLPLSAEEKNRSTARSALWSDGGRKHILGINTGCSHVIAAKKLSVAFQREICKQYAQQSDVQIVLLGGPEDTERNLKIAAGFEHVIVSDSTSGLRDGLISVAACDSLVTGDSLGMHLGISQRKWIVAWFGPTCAQEIDLFHRGVKVMSQAECAPCWKRSCQKSLMCYDQVSLKEIISGVEKGIQFWQQTSLSKQPFSEISF